MILPFIYSSLDECVALPLRLIAVSHAQSGEIRPLPRPPASPMYVFGFKLRTLTDVSESTMCTKRPHPARGWASLASWGCAQPLPKPICYALKKVILGQTAPAQHMGTVRGVLEPFSSKIRHITIASECIHQHPSTTTLCIEINFWEQLSSFWPQDVAYICHHIKRYRGATWF